jgi:hypothetical protein
MDCVTEYGPQLDESPGSGALTQELAVPEQPRADKRLRAGEAPESGAHPGALRDLLPWSSPPPGAAVAPGRTMPGVTRSPALGLPLLIVLGLVAAFFGWVSAQPFWLSFGAGATGTVTISSCHDGRCAGTFTSGEFSADPVRVSAVPSGSRHTGATVPARMLTARSGWAYTSNVSDLGLRWKAGLGIVLLCGFGAGIATGIATLSRAGRRRQLVLWGLAMGGPLAIFAGTLVAALL